MVDNGKGFVPPDFPREQLTTTVTDPSELSMISMAEVTITAGGGTSASASGSSVRSSASGASSAAASSSSPMGVASGTAASTASPTPASGSNFGVAGAVVGAAALLAAFAMM